jgi:hypothetical protein
MQHVAALADPSKSFQPSHQLWLKLEGTESPAAGLHPLCKRRSVKDDAICHTYVYVPVGLLCSSSS